MNYNEINNTICNMNPLKILLYGGIFVCIVYILFKIFEWHSENVSDRESIKDVKRNAVGGEKE